MAPAAGPARLLLDAARAARGPVQVRAAWRHAFELSGPDRHALLNRVGTNDVAALAPGRWQATLLCTAGGAVVADLVAYRLPDKLLVTADAPARAAAWEALVARKRGANVRLKAIAEETALVGVGGPGAAEVLARLGAPPLPEGGVALARVAEVQCFAAARDRGLVTHELFCRARDAERLEGALAAAGAAPIGAGAVEMARIARGTPRAGADFVQELSPLEAGLGALVALEKGAHFPGEAALRAELARPALRRLARLELRDGALPRAGQALAYRGRVVGAVTSGGVRLPGRVGVALGILPADLVVAGLAVELDSRHGPRDLDVLGPAVP